MPHSRHPHTPWAAHGLIDFRGMLDAAAAGVMGDTGGGCIGDLRVGESGQCFGGETMRWVDFGVHTVWTN